MISKKLPLTKSPPLNFPVLGLRFTALGGELVGKRVMLRAHISGESAVKDAFVKRTIVCATCGTRWAHDPSFDPRRLYGLMAGSGGGHGRLSK
jgi:hypothetical protein